MSYGMGDWLTLIVMGLCLGFGWAIGSAVANAIIGLLKRT